MSNIEITPINKRPKKRKQEKNKSIAFLVSKSTFGWVKNERKKPKKKLQAHNRKSNSRSWVRYDIKKKIRTKISLFKYK